MYTRYTGISIPSNYNGSRFSKSNETSTKIHTSKAQESSVKSSISPSFEETLTLSNYNPPLEETEAEALTQDNALKNDAKDISDDTNEASNTDADHQNDNTQSAPTHINNPIFSDFFKFVKGDDILLITLIIMLASENTLNNYDIIILLSLLLAYHA